jgi:NADH pyrophosphatase NudC (nudix superfamily)
MNTEKLEIYKRPQEWPVNVELASNIRLHYNGQWIDFRDGRVIVTDEEMPLEKCRCYKFYQWQNKYNFCPDCGRDLRPKKCKLCDGTKMVQMGPGLRGMKQCPACTGK